MCALASGLVTQAQLDEARAALAAGAGPDFMAGAAVYEERLAQKLVELGRLNAWQAKQLLEGRTKFNLGPYRMIDSLGRGGMGQVFKGEHTVLHRVVAVKVLPRHKSSPEAVQNFLREIRAQAMLDHPNLVRALDAGMDGNVVYLVTEYVPGNDLRKLIRRFGPLRMHAAAAIISQVAAGLHHAHQKGLIHRDVKPGNILVTAQGWAKLSDLGLAGPAGRDAVHDPRYGRIVGTVDYLSPDHIRDPHHPTPAWDIYSLGCTLYYAVTGKVPFPGGSTADKVRAHCELKPLDPRRLNPELDAAFVDVMADMMAKNPDERINSASEVISRLAPWADIPYPLDESAWLRSAADRPRRRRLRVAVPLAWDQLHLAETKPNLPAVSGVVPLETETNAEPHTTGTLIEPSALPVGLSRTLRPTGAKGFVAPMIFFVLLPALLMAAVFLFWKLFLH
ncbi:MAG: serine/threonine protein kinase [Thermogutta sp.]|nr:serine/threonine protein kinase [Thermogutta sp.]